MKSEAKDESTPDPEDKTESEPSSPEEEKAEASSAQAPSKEAAPSEEPTKASVPVTKEQSPDKAEEGGSKDAEGKVAVSAEHAVKDKVADLKVPSPEKPKPQVPVRGVEPELWKPKTRLGHMVKDGEITNISDALNQGLPLREPEIVDILLPDLDDEVLDVNMVQRMTDSGRRVKFSITTVVGNKDGYVGLGHSKGKEVGPAIRKAIDNAKINIMEIKRGCGSWECGCDKAHSLPFVVKGKSGSTVVHLKPAPQGINLAVGNIAKHVLRLAGIKDAWGFTKGETRTTINYAKAIIAALRKTTEMKVTESQMQKLHIIKGSLGEMREGGEDAEVESETKPDDTPKPAQPAPSVTPPSSEPEPASSHEAEAAKPSPKEKDNIDKEATS